MLTIYSAFAWTKGSKTVIINLFLGIKKAIKMQHSSPLSNSYCDKPLKFWPRCCVLLQLFMMLQYFSTPFWPGDEICLFFSTIR